MRMASWTRVLRTRALSFPDAYSLLPPSVSVEVFVVGWAPFGEEPEDRPSLGSLEAPSGPVGGALLP
jgi:hypothetical protein